MRAHPAVRYVAVLGSLALLTATSHGAPASRRDLGDEPRYAAMKNRGTAPTSKRIDGNISLRGLLEAKNESAFSTANGATITGHVIQVEREPDGDVHLALADAAHETNTTRWVIVEVTPAWQKRGASLGLAHLRSLVGREVRVTGWLFYEPDTQSEDPRGTRWELHPVTSIKTLD